MPNPKGSRMPPEFMPLAVYNAEVGRGIIHTTTWTIKMEQLQKEYDRWRAGPPWAAAAFRR